MMGKEGGANGGREGGVLVSRGRTSGRGGGAATRERERDEVKGLWRMEGVITRQR